MQKINLLYVITKLELGGAQKQLLSLIRNLDREKFNLLLFTAREGLLIQEASSISGLTLKKSRWLGRPINPFGDLLALIEICVFIKKNKVDIVHTHSSKAGILGRLAAVLSGIRAVVHTVHGWSFNDCQFRIKRALFIWLERIAGMFTDKLIVVCEHDRIKGLRHRIGNKEKYAVIHYGIDYREFMVDDLSLKENLGIKLGDPVITLISCLKPQKSPADFIRLASLVALRLPGVKFIIAGDGVLRRKVEDSVDRLGLKENVILLGWRRDIPRILSITEILVLTSLWEGMPITVLEGMSSGKPVIATKTGGIEEIVKDGDTGFLVDPGDMETMSERINTLLGNSQLRRQMGQKARDSLGFNFATATMLKDTQDLYLALAGERRIAYAN